MFASAGWKYVHGDVFRLPQNINLLSAILGTGTQILVLTFSVFGLALLGTYNPTKRGAIMASGVFLYALTASVAGYTAGMSCRHAPLLSNNSMQPSVRRCAGTICAAGQMRVQRVCLCGCSAAAALCI